MARQLPSGPATTRHEDHQARHVRPGGRQERPFTFCLVSSLFLLWGFCNGMIDVMDKHFQEELHLSLSQSAWVQFAHWMGYFLMSIPAGWLATRLGYKGGIIAGLLLVAVGGFWFIPASKIAAFWAFLLGVCVVASGLTFLETVANPYTTVLGPPRYAATRINAAQSCNGVGWIFGPDRGQHVLLRHGRRRPEHRLPDPLDSLRGRGGGRSHPVDHLLLRSGPRRQGRGRLQAGRQGQRPDAGRRAARESGVVLSAAAGQRGRAHRRDHLHPLADVRRARPRPAAWWGWRRAFLIRRAVVVSAENSIEIVLAAGACLAMLVAAVALADRITKRLTHHSVWSHEHFSGATLAQFLYVAAQCGIFSFLINYMTSEPPSLPSSVDERRHEQLDRGPDGLCAARTSRTCRPWPRN